MPSTFCVYSLINRPSLANVDSIWWNAVGLAALTRCDIDRTMSWNDDVEESVWYTDASKRCFPDAFNLCSLLKVLNRPVVERKSGTRYRSVRYRNTIEQHLLPAETDIPAPTITTILRRFRSTFNNRSNGAFAAVA